MQFSDKQFNIGVDVAFTIHIEEVMCSYLGWVTGDPE
jgi:hypothetical protein